MRKELGRLIDTCDLHATQETQKQYEGFTKLFHRFLDETGPSVNWSKIEKLPCDAIKNYSLLEIPSTCLTQQMLSKLVVVKLNGGLGTSMGCYGPKSVITVRNNLTFLDLTVQQLEVKKFELTVQNLYVQFWTKFKYGNTVFILHTFSPIFLEFLLNL